MNSREFFYDFGRALYRVDSFYDEFAKKSNVSSALLWVLYALNDGNPHTQREESVLNPEMGLMPIFGLWTDCSCAIKYFIRKTVWQMV